MSEFLWMKAVLPPENIMMGIIGIYSGKICGAAVRTLLCARQTARGLPFAAVCASMILAGVAAPPPMPDFIIESMSYSQTSFASGSPVTLSITVKNQGDAAGEGRYVDVWYCCTNVYGRAVGDVGDFWAPVGRLDPGASRTIVTPPHPAGMTLGTNNVCAIIEFENYVSEAFNTNNHFCVPYVVEEVSTQVHPVHRFWSDVLMCHFYTISEAEKNKVMTNLADIWRYEGPMFYAYTNQVPGASPVHRFWSDVLMCHFYTISEAEKNKVIANLSNIWRYEGIVYYAFETQAAGSSPVYRFWSDVLMCHFYTISETEKNKVIANLSDVWRYEGPMYYAFSSGPPPLTGTEYQLLPLSEGVPAGASYADSNLAKAQSVAVGTSDSGLVGSSFAVSAALTSLGCVSFPLSFADSDVTAYVHDLSSGGWTCIQPATNSPASVEFSGVQAGHAYMLDVWVRGNGSADFANVHRSWFEWNADAPAALPGEVLPNSIAAGDADGVGLPAVRIALPEDEGSITVKMYDADMQMVRSENIASGAGECEVSMPEWNRWYWVGGWRDSDQSLAFSIWIRHGK